MMRVELRGRVQRPRPDNGGVQRRVDGIATWTCDDRHPQCGRDGHRITPGVGGRRPNDLKTFDVVLRPVGESWEPRVAVTPGGPQHSRAVRSNPDLWPLAFVLRQIEDRIAQGEERRITVDQFALRVPQRADGGKGLLEPGNGFRPVDAVGLVAHALSGTDARNSPSTSHQVQRRSGLRGHGGVAFAGIGDADTETDSVEATARRQAAQQGPGLHRRIGRPQQTCRRRVPRVPQRSRCLTIDVVGNPVRVNAIGNGRKVARTTERIDSGPRGHDRVHQTDTESGHYCLARYAVTIGSSSSGVAPCMINASAP